jgi:anaerobic ribonucleoside-triphosphate reductase activating protein
MGLNVWTYTGYTWDDLTGMIKRPPQWWMLLKETDVLVDGPFIQEEKSLDLLYRGSRNQRLIDVQKSLSEGKIVLWVPE